jgi:NAD-dependent dihydropyrimidine dehydrogenase PreA subunit
VPRKIIQIDESLCDGCGECIPSCAEGALYLENGKAKLAADKLCDGLGACLGECPRGALKVIERDAEAFDEAAVHAHLLSLGHPANPGVAAPPPVTLHGGGCPGANVVDLTAALSGAVRGAGPVGPRRRLSVVPDAPPAAPAGVDPLADPTHANGSRLGQWPVQLRLVSPAAPYFQGADLLVAADCVPFAYGNFHQDFLAGKRVVVGCPKLDDVDEQFRKLAAIVSVVRSVTVVKMAVPCCNGIAQAAEAAVARAGRPIPIETVTIGLRGEVV